MKYEESIKNFPKKRQELPPEYVETAVAIPNEGRFLWKLAYKMTSGIEFKKRFGLDYETMMRYEHVNNADEIEAILKHDFKKVKCSLLGVSKTFSFYRYYECRQPIVKRNGVDREENAETLSYIKKKG